MCISLTKHKEGGELLTHKMLPASNWWKHAAQANYFDLTSDYKSLTVNVSVVSEVHSGAAWKAGWKQCGAEAGQEARRSTISWRQLCMSPQGGPQPVDCLTLSSKFVTLKAGPSYFVPGTDWPDTLSFASVGHRLSHFVTVNEKS